MTLPESSRVCFSKSGKVLDWDPEAENLLEFLEDNGLTPDNSCRGGMCSTCETSMASGSVEYVTEPSVDIEDGHVLLCSSIPTSDIALDL